MCQITTHARKHEKKVTCEVYCLDSTENSTKRQTGHRKAVHHQCGSKAAARKRGWDETQNRTLVKTTTVVNHAMWETYVATEMGRGRRADACQHVLVISPSRLSLHQTSKIAGARTRDHNNVNTDRQRWRRHVLGDVLIASWENAEMRRDEIQHARLAGHRPHVLSFNRMSLLLFTNRKLIQKGYLGKQKPSSDFPSQTRTIFY